MGKYRLSKIIQSQLALMNGIYPHDLQNTILNDSSLRESEIHTMKLFIILYPYNYKPYRIYPHYICILLDFHVLFAII